VPPTKCPECGRFLKGSLVASLTADPVPCPRCETGLVAAMFPEEASVRPPDLGSVTADPAAGTHTPPPPGTPVPPAPPSPSAASIAAERGSVRPPDLVPVMVRDEPRDALAGWDVGAGAAELDRWRDDRPPFPTDAAVLAGAGVLGALVGALAAPRRGRNAVIGGGAGVLGAAVLRQVWRLDP
jgi:hypothetical protein